MLVYLETSTGSSLDHPDCHEHNLCSSSCPLVALLSLSVAVTSRFDPEVLPSSDMLTNDIIQGVS